MKFLILFFLISCTNLFCQDVNLQIIIDSSKIYKDSIEVVVNLKNSSSEKKYYCDKKNFTNVFCSSYWYFLLKENTERKSLECYVHSKIRAGREYVPILPGEIFSFKCKIKISTETMIKAENVKRHYTLQVIYRDAFLRHRKALKLIESNIVGFYY